MAVRFSIDTPSTWGYFNQSPNSRPMGLGALANPGLVFKRKFRWTLAIQFCLTGTIQTVPEEFVKVGARPQLDVEETEINYLNGKFWIPGKVTPQTMTVTYYDVAGAIVNTPDTCDQTDADPNIACFPCFNDEDLPYSVGADTLPQTGTIFNWIASIYNITDPCRLEMGSKTGDYQGEGLLRLYDGCGQTVEAWLMQNMWPQSVNFGELDMASSDECTIELTLRYSSLQYRSLCPAQSIVRCPCSPCVE